MNKISQNNIFIAHTPLQNFIVKKIIEQYFASAYYCNFLFTSVVTESGKFLNEINLINKETFKLKIKQLPKERRKILKILRDNNKSEVFIPHTSALLDNYLFYSFPSKKHGVKLNFYYEGILYFYNYRENYNYRIHLKRMVFGLLTGIRYKFHSEIFPANSNKINKIYSIFPTFTIGCKKKMKEIVLLEQCYSSKKNVVLILGGKPSLLNNQEVILIYREILKDIKDEFGNCKILFKGHHADTTNNFEIAAFNTIIFDDITEVRAVEEVIKDYRPSAIYSYPSSALVNLKAMYNTKIKLSSYYIDDKKEHLSMLCPIFESLGINLKTI